MTQSTKLVFFPEQSLPSEVGSSGGADPALHTVEILRERYAERPCLRLVAREVGCHERTLERALKRTYGRSFREILQIVRLRAALRLLAESTAKVEVVALEVGFKSRGALGKLLRRYDLPCPVRLKGVSQEE